MIDVIGHGTSLVLVSYRINLRRKYSGRWHSPSWKNRGKPWIQFASGSPGHSVLRSALEAKHHMPPGIPLGSPRHHCPLHCPAQHPLLSVHAPCAMTVRRSTEQEFGGNTILDVRFLSKCFFIMI